MVYELHIPSFLPREWLTRVVWKRKADKIVVVYESTEHPDFPIGDSYVRALSYCSYEFQRLPPVNGIPQTHVTYNQQLDLGGALPRFIVNARAVTTLLYLSSMRKKFDNSKVVDRVSRELNVVMIENHDTPYSAAENSLLEDGLGYFSFFEKSVKSKRLRMDSPLTAAEIAFDKHDSYAWGWATSIVRASPQEILAYMWDTMKRSSSRSEDFEKSVDEVVNEHNQLIYIHKHVKAPLANRDFYSRAVWKDMGDFLLVVYAAEDSTKGDSPRPLLNDRVRAKMPMAMKMKQRPNGSVRIEFVIHPDAGGE